MSTPDRPATTPEGAGHRYISTACQHGEHQRCRLSCKFCGTTCRCAACDVDGEHRTPARLSERTEGAEEVALSEVLLGGLLAEYGADRETWTDTGSLRRIVAALEANILARRDLPTAGRVVEVERVAEQVEALADLVRLKDGPRDDAYRAEKEAAWERARRALAAAIRAGGTE